MEAQEPMAVDPDIDLHVPKQARELSAAVVAVISAGGVLGSLSRYGLGEAFPHGPGSWPWATWLINVGGCLLIGVLMVLIGELWPDQRLIRPFFGVGVLGGFTTFSTATIDVQQLVGHGAAGLALLYLGGTLLGALFAAAAGTAVTRLALGRLS